MLKKFICFSWLGLLSACTQNHLAIDNLSTENQPVKPITQTQFSHKPLTAKDIKHPQGENATPDEIAECQKQGGTISKQGLMAHDFCVVEFADKGKVCTDGSECQAGRCIAEIVADNTEISSSVKGVCPSNNIPFGCYGMVNKGKFGGFLCVD